MNDENQLALPSSQILSAQVGPLRLQHFVGTSVDAFVGRHRGQIGQTSLKAFAVLNTGFAERKKLTKFLVVEWIIESLDKTCHYFEGISLPYGRPRKKSIKVPRPRIYA